VPAMNRAGERKKTKMNANQSVYVVLSRSQTALSRTIHMLKGHQYTHAALSLDRSMQYMFSFGRRRASNPFIGCFRRERLDDGIYKFCSNLPGVILEIPVTPVQYRNISGQIGTFLLNSHIYSYNYLGLAGNLFNKKHQDNTRFFCSEFVYHVNRFLLTLLPSKLYHRRNGYILYIV
jgi:hypothetical protein